MLFSLLYNGVFVLAFSISSTKAQSFCSELQLAEGVVTCSNSNNLNSTCTFTCNEGFTLIGSSTSQCRDAGEVALWDPLIPQCPDRDECSNPGEHNCSFSAECQNTYGNYSCICGAGFVGDGFNCTDVDECETNPGCHEKAKCNNAVGTFSCFCEDGYTGNGTHCEDVDECSQWNLQDCSSNATCVNLNGSYSCVCRGGFFANDSTSLFPTCFDIDECIGQNSSEGSGDQSSSSSDFLCDSNADCLNSVGTFVCSCRSGFVGNGRTCEDIDECSVSTRNNCDDKAICNNSHGGFSCFCKDGFIGNGTFCQDIDECSDYLPETEKCDQHALCENTIGSYRCSCWPGFEGNGTVCEDTDECEDRSLSNCSDHAHCNNTIGSYRCTCNSGYSGNGKLCDDFDECASNPCDANAACVNLLGTHVCICRRGYSGNGSFCADINECNSTDAKRCSDNALCTNTHGSYRCFCNLGFIGNGFLCKDIDECGDSLNNCGDNSICTNLPGNHSCSCKPGFTLLNGSCVDENECLRSPTVCGNHSLCSNYPGKFACKCLPGFDPSNKTCVDHNECLDKQNNCHQNATCINTIGSYKCKCIYGMKGDGTNCRKQEWCAIAKVRERCHLNAFCKNVFPDFECICKFGYTGNGTNCANVNECAAAYSNNCDPNADCEDTPGNYTCTCKERYYGNGFSCRAKPVLPRPLELSKSENCITVQVDSKRAYGLYQVRARSRFGTIVKTVSSPCVAFCGLSPGTTYAISAAVVTLLNSNMKITNPIFSEQTSITTRHRKYYFSCYVRQQTFQPAYVSLYSPASVRFQDRFRPVLSRQFTRWNNRYRFRNQYSFYRPKFIGFRRGSVIASIEIEANTSNVEESHLNEIFSDSQNFSNPQMLPKLPALVNFTIANISNESVIFSYSAYPNASHYEFEVACENFNATRRKNQLEDLSVIFDDIPPNQACSAKAKVLVEVSNTSVVFTNYTEALIFSTLPHISNFTVTPSDTSMILQFDYVNGLSSYTVSAKSFKTSITRKMTMDNYPGSYIDFVLTNLTQNTKYDVILQVFANDLNDVIQFATTNASVKTKDTDECSNDLHLCDQNEKCINTVGNYYCVCEHGYKKSKLQLNCKKVADTSSLWWVALVVVLGVLLIIGFALVIHSIHSKKKC